MTMPAAPARWIALVRAINVGGQSLVAMAKLRALFESFGATDVSTYIQTGNVIFSSTERDGDRLGRRLEAHLARALPRGPAVVVLSPGELRRAAARNPFEPAGRDRGWQCHLLFLSAAPDAPRRKALAALQRERDDYRFELRGRVLYWGYPKKLAGRRRSIDFERVLGVAGTSRNWKVVDALIERAVDSGSR
jgi:uncharacterized protein (DUF1697 family)